MPMHWRNRKDKETTDDTTPILFFPFKAVLRGTSVLKGGFPMDLQKALRIDRTPWESLKIGFPTESLTSRPQDKVGLVVLKPVKRP